MRRLITLLVMVTLATTAGLVAPRPASACSCMELDPTASLGDYEAAFVGTLVDVDGQVGAIFDSAADTVYRFEVETWVKGDLGDVVEIHSAAGGASCGIEVGIGGRIGILVRVEGGEYHSSLCESIDAEVLLAASQPPDVGAPGPATLLVSAPIGDFDYITVNSSGGIVDGLRRTDQEPFNRPWQFSRCPESDLIVEVWSGRLVVRDLADLDVVREIDLSQAEDLGSSAADA